MSSDIIFNTTPSYDPQDSMMEFFDADSYYRDTEPLPPPASTTTNHYHSESIRSPKTFQPLSPSHTSFDNPTPCSSYMGSEDSPDSFSSFDSFLSIETPSPFISTEPINMDMDILRAFGDVVDMPVNNLDSAGEFFTELLPPVDNPFPTPSTSANPSPLLQRAPLPTPLPQMLSPSSVHTPAKTKSTVPARPFACDHPMCGKSYPRACDLNKHKKRHQKPFPCRYVAQERCMNAFSTAKERDRHEKSKHRREDHLVCVTCGHSTARKDNMLDHIKRRHGEEDKDRATLMILGL